MRACYLEDELRRAGGHLLDVHASLRTAHHHRPVAGAVHEDGEVGLPGDVQRFGNHHLGHHGHAERADDSSDTQLAY